MTKSIVLKMSPIPNTGKIRSATAMPISCEAAGIPIPVVAIYMNKGIPYIHPKIVAKILYMVPSMVNSQTTCQRVIPNDI